MYECPYDFLPIAQIHTLSLIRQVKLEPVLNPLDERDAAGQRKLPAAAMVRETE